MLPETGVARAGEFWKAVEASREAGQGLPLTTCGHPTNQVTSDFFFLKKQDL